MTDALPRPDDAAPDARPADAAAPVAGPAGAAGAPATPDALPPATRSLAESVAEIERHVATAGWDGPVRLFALVLTGRALAADPALSGQLPPEVVAAGRADPHHLTSVEQEELPDAPTLEDLLAGVSWPPSVDGAAVVVERVVLPPAAEEGMPADPDAALAYLMSHPDRQDVRIAVGVLRSGASWCAVRTRAQDADDAVGGGPDVVPGLVQAVRATLD